jgi:hypothetical protein
LACPQTWAWKEFRVLALPQNAPSKHLKKLFQSLFLLFACLHLAGGQYAVVQVYAWGNMLVSYSKESGFLKGAEDTFSGKKPCHLCCKIAQAKMADAEGGKQEAPPTPPLFAKAPEFVAANSGILKAPIAVDAPPVVFVAPILFIRPGIHAPPVPPPRQELI